MPNGGSFLSPAVVDKTRYRSRGLQSNVRKTRSRRKAISGLEIAGRQEQGDNHLFLAPALMNGVILFQH